MAIMNEDNETLAAEPAAETSPKQPSLLRNWLSFIGLAIVVASLTSIGLLVLIELSSGDDNPYTVLVTYILLPSVLGFGIALVLLGMLIERRRRRRDPDAHIAQYPVLDLNDPTRRRRVLLLLGLSFIFLFLSAFGSYRAYEYTESVAFCGQQCHAVMKPEFVAYNASPHARVRCVECHVGGGPERYVRSKFNGMHQLWAVTFNTYNRPIQTPLHNLRPADETCAKCHWPEKFFGEQMKVFNHFGYDETNSLNQTRMLIKTGGGSPSAGEVGGIHWHMNVANEITYIAADERRQDIPWVRLKDRDGKITEHPVPTPNSSLRGVTVGRDGHLWYTANAVNKIGCMTTSGNVLGEFPIPTPASGARCIASMSDGRLFFTQWDAGLIGEVVVH